MLPIVQNGIITFFGFSSRLKKDLKKNWIYAITWRYLTTCCTYFEFLPSSGFFFKLGFEKTLSCNFLLERLTGNYF